MINQDMFPPQPSPQSPADLALALVQGLIAVAQNPVAAQSTLDQIKAASAAHDKAKVDAEEAINLAQRKANDAEVSAAQVEADRQAVEAQKVIDAKALSDRAAELTRTHAEQSRRQGELEALDQSLATRAANLNESERSLNDRKAQIVADRAALDRMIADNEATAARFAAALAK